MVGRDARMVWKHPFMLRVTISSNSSGVVCTPVLPIGPEPPATLTRTSRRPPNASLVAPTAASHCRASVRSQAMTIALPPLAFTSPATGAMAAVSRPTSASLQPSAAKAWVMAAPIPFAGPVINTTRSSSSNLMVWYPWQISKRWERATRPALHGGADRGRPFAERRQKAAIENLVEPRRARQFLGLDQDVDRLGHSSIVDVAEADFGDLRVAHLFRQ